MADKKTASHYGIWPTAWGPMAAASRRDRIMHIVLPHYQLDELEQLMQWQHPRARRDDDEFGILIDLSRLYFNARRVDFGEVPCDMPPAGTFGGKVLRAARQIPYGQTLSYSQLALRIGRPQAARAVATALSRNPLPLVVPCHRVVYADGRLGGFAAPGGVEQKRRMLAMERRVKPPRQSDATSDEAGGVVA